MNIKKNFLTAITIGLVLVLSIIFLDRIASVSSQITGTLLLVALIVSSLAILFIIVKSGMLFFTLQKFSIPITIQEAAKIFCMSIFFEVTTFSGKFGSEGFKYFFLKEYPKKTRFKALLFVRWADISAYFLVLFFFFSPVLTLVIFLILLIIVPIMVHQNKAIYPFITKSKFFSTIKEHWIFFFLMILLSSVSYIIMLTQLTLVFSTLGLSVNFNTPLLFHISHGVGILSLLPLGIGAKDFSIFFQLKDILSSNKIILGILWVRLFGEFLTAFIGGSFAIIYLKKKNPKTNNEINSRGLG